MSLGGDALVTVSTAIRCGVSSRRPQRSQSPISPFIMPISACTMAISPLTMRRFQRSRFPDAYSPAVISITRT